MKININVGEFSNKSISSIFFLIVCSKFISKTVDVSNTLNYFWRKLQNFVIQNGKILRLLKTFLLIRVNESYPNLIEKIYFSKKFFNRITHFNVSRICESNTFINSFQDYKKCIFTNILYKHSFLRTPNLISKNLQKLNKKLNFINKYKWSGLENFYYFNRIFRYKYRNSINFLTKKGPEKKNFGKISVDIYKINQTFLKIFFNALTVLSGKRIGRIECILKKFIDKESESIENIYGYKKAWIFGNSFLYFILDKTILHGSNMKNFFARKKKKKEKNFRKVSEKKKFENFLEKSGGNLKNKKLNRFLKFSDILNFNKKIKIQKNMLGNFKQRCLNSFINCKIIFFSNKQNVIYQKKSEKFLIFDQMILNNLTGFYNIKNNLFTIDSTGRFLKKKWIINNYQQTILKEKSLLMIRINNNKNLITKIIKNAKQFLTHKGKMIEIVLFFKIFSNFYEKSLLLEGGKIAKKFAIIRIIFFQKKIIQKLIGINREIFCSYIKNQTKTISHLKINGKIFIFEKKLKKIKSILFCEKEDDKNKLIESLKQRINCPIKYNLEKNVVLTKCGHSFSSACIKDLIQKRNRKCPLCGQRFGLDNIKTLFLV